jgi:hypothetical protein
VPQTPPLQRIVYISYLSPPGRRTATPDTISRKETGSTHRLLLGIAGSDKDSCSGSSGRVAVLSRYMKFPGGSLFGPDISGGCLVATAIASPTHGDP